MHSAGASAGKPSASSRSPRATNTRKRTSASSTSSRLRPAASSAGSMWKFYSGDDSPGKQIGPVPVLVLSLLFIAVVFLLHIWGKYSRS